MFQADRVAYANGATQKRLTWLLDGAYTNITYVHMHRVGAGSGRDQGDKQKEFRDTDRTQSKGHQN